MRSTRPTRTRPRGGGYPFRAVWEPGRASTDMNGGRPRDAVFPESLVPVAARVETRIDDLLAGEIARWGAVDANLVQPIGALRSFVAAGGKRLRPAFCHCAFIGAGGDAD